MKISPLRGCWQGRGAKQYEFSELKKTAQRLSDQASFILEITEEGEYEQAQRTSQGDPTVSMRSAVDSTSAQRCFSLRREGWVLSLEFS